MDPAADEQEVVVRVEDDPTDLEKPRGKQDWQVNPHSIWYPRTTGIWQTVWLERVPALRIAQLTWTWNVERWEIGLDASIAVLKTIRRLEALSGFCYRQLTDTYQEANGLLYADRTPKLRLEVIQRAILGMEDLITPPPHRGGFERGGKAMTDSSNQSHIEALRRATEIEFRWQDARAQRQRASELFSEDLPEPEDREDDE